MKEEVVSEDVGLKFKTEQDVSLFEKVQAQMHGLYAEMGVYAKKSPDSAVNKFKLKVINTVILETNKILGLVNKPFEDFNSFDEDSLPTNSDIVIILSQYLNCLEKLRSEHVHFEFGKWVWIIGGVNSSIRTAQPQKLDY